MFLERLRRQRKSTLSSEVMDSLFPSVKRSDSSHIANIRMALWLKNIRNDTVPVVLVYEDVRETKRLGKGWGRGKKEPERWL